MSKRRKYMRQISVGNVMVCFCLIAPSALSSTSLGNEPTPGHAAPSVSLEVRQERRRQAKRLEKISLGGWVLSGVLVASCSYFRAELTATQNAIARTDQEERRSYEDHKRAAASYAAMSTEAQRADIACIGGIISISASTGVLIYRYVKY